MVPIELRVRYSSGSEWHSDLPWRMKGKVMKVRFMNLKVLAMKVEVRMINVKVMESDIIWVKVLETKMEVMKVRVSLMKGHNK